MKEETKKCPSCQSDIPSKAKKCVHCKTDLRSWFSRHPILTGLGFLVIILIVSASSADNKNTSTPSPVSTNQNVVASTPEPVDPAILEANKARLEELKKNFTYKYDEFNNIGWYTHKNQLAENSYNRRLIKVPVNNRGYGYLESQYYGENWIFHTRVEVKVGELVLKSQEVPTYDPDNATQNSGGSVWEVVSFTGNKDNGIIQAIASSGDLDVRVRFSGDQKNSDFTLTKKDQQAIKDSYELMTLIKKVGNQ
ncbi:MAG: hypothetical protein R3B39_02435 [Candidatus Paceibacterota bacterium]